MSASSCHNCRQSKAPYECGKCGVALCKKCTEFLPRNSFELNENIEEVLTKESFCPGCYVHTVAPALASYERTVARAKSVYIFDTEQGEETRRIKRARKPYQVKDCVDRRQTLMRLAFFAASENFNALIDVDLRSEKVTHPGGYQTLKWQGSGVPTQVDGKKLESGTKWF